MKDTFTRENARDFNARYIETYGYVNSVSQGRMPVFLRNIEDQTLHFENLEGVPYHTYRDTGYEFEFAPLRKKIYVGADGELYCSARIPERQWRRGICSGNTRLVKLTGEGPKPISVNHKNMKNILFEGKTTSNNIKLSDSFGIVRGIVYLYDNIIGEVKGSIILLLKGQELFQQELLDAINKNGLKYEVKNA